MRRPGKLAQNTLAVQGEDHRVTAASWALCSPFPSSHSWRNGEGGRGAQVPRATAAVEGPVERLGRFGLEVSLQGWNSQEALKGGGGEVRAF